MKITLELDGIEFSKAISDGTMAGLCASVAGLDLDVAVTNADAPPEPSKPERPKASPKKPAPAPEPKAEPKEEEETGPEPTMTEEDGLDEATFRMRVSKVNRAAEGNVDKVRAIFEAAGYAKLSDVPGADRMALLLRAEELL